MSSATTTAKRPRARSERLGRSALTGVYVLKPATKLKPARARQIARAVREVIESRHR